MSLEDDTNQAPSELGAGPVEYVLERTDGTEGQYLRDTGLGRS